MPINSMDDIPVMEYEFTPIRQYSVSFSFGDLKEPTEEELSTLSSLSAVVRRSDLGRHETSLIGDLEDLALKYGGGEDHTPKSSRSGKAVRMTYSFDSPEGRTQFMEDLREMYTKPLRVKYFEWDGGVWKAPKGAWWDGEVWRPPVSDEA